MVHSYGHAFETGYEKGYDAAMIIRELASEWYMEPTKKMCETLFVRASHTMWAVDELCEYIHKYLKPEEWDSGIVDVIRAFYMKMQFGYLASKLEGSKDMFYDAMSVATDMLEVFEAAYDCLDDDMTLEEAIECTWIS